MKRVAAGLPDGDGEHRALDPCFELSSQCLASSIYFSCKDTKFSKIHRCIALQFFTCQINTRFNKPQVSCILERNVAVFSNNCEGFELSLHEIRGYDSSLQFTIVRVSAGICVCLTENLNLKLVPRLF